MRVLGLSLCFFALITSAAAAESKPSLDAEASYEEMQAFIASLQARVERLSTASRGTDDAIEYLSRQIDSAIGTLSSNREETEALRQHSAVLSEQRDQATLTRAQRDLALANLHADKAETVGTLEEEVAKLASLLSAERDAAIVLRESLKEKSAALDAGLAERDRLKRELLETRKLTESRIDELTQSRDALQDRLDSTELEAARMRGELAATKEDMAAEGALLAGQIAALRQQLARLVLALDTAESANSEKDLRIADLGNRLNVALASKVEELQKYRSEFFGRLRQLLGERSDVRIVGDRFVFQSEVLFNAGEAALGGTGREQLQQFGSSLREIASSIPADVDWVLRIDGHTDERPIQTDRFPSNWELSTARAVSVAKFLIREGIPADRLIAAGFAEFHPLDSGSDEIAFRRNRRIEFKLTQK